MKGKINLPKPLKKVGIIRKTGIYKNHHETPSESQGYLQKIIMKHPASHKGIYKNHHETPSESQGYLQKSS